MRKFYQFLLVTIILGSGAFLFSCDGDDDTPDWKNIDITNAALKSILQQKGYTFNEAGQLVQDDKVAATTSLDLSGTKLADFSGLEALPNLKELILADNGYGPVFDFSALPAQITAVDLTGNKLFDFEGLVDVKVENDERQTTVLRAFTKLYLPEAAKYNVEDLMPYYEKAGASTDMQMQDAKGKLQPYTTLREIPDQYFRTYLKTLFASLFPGDGTQIDISKPMALAESGNNINLWYDSQFADIGKIKSIEGVEYFINNPYYKSFYVSIGYTSETPITVSYLVPRANIKGILFSTVSTPDGVDLSGATSLASLTMGYNDYLTELDLSNTLVFNQKLSDIESSIGNTLSLTHCQNLRTIRFPKQAEGIVWGLLLGDLPALEELDLGFVYAAQNLYLMQLPKCNITYPYLKYYFNGAKKILQDFSVDNQVFFAVSQDVFDMESTKAFITKYRFPNPDYNPDDYSDKYLFYLRDAYRSYRKTFAAIEWSTLMQG
jgi:Leucine-rich repeat (LRR) protein